MGRSQLVSDKHDEAMVMLRVPSHPSQEIATLVAAVNAAIASSAYQSPSAVARGSTRSLVRRASSSSPVASRP